MDHDAWRSLLSLALLLVVSIGSAVGLRRRARATVNALALGSVYAAILIAWTAIVSSRELSPASAPERTAQIFSLVLALGTLATVPIALVFAWPLRRVAAGSEPGAELTPDS
jgi:ribosomal protein L30/L7E